MSYIDELIRYHRVTAPDKDSLAELVTRAKGPRRSMRQFASECNVNPSTLSRIVNKKTQGSNTDDLIATIADHADPDSGVTFEMLMRAHGMALITDDSSVLIRLHIEAVRKTILGELLRRFYSLRDGKEPWLNSFLGRCMISTDLRTNALGETESVWLMDIWHLRSEEEADIKKASDRLRQWLLMYVGMLNVDGRRVDRFSIILTNEELFTTIVAELEKFSYRNDLSIILVDIRSERVVEEYLVKMPERKTTENVFFQVEEDSESEDEEDSVVCFDRPEII